MSPKSARGPARLILGIDPGSAVAGYGLLRVEGQTITALDHGVLRVGRPVASFPVVLRRLFEEVEALIERMSPDVVAIEQVFNHLNPRAALKLAHARGVVLLAAARAGVEVREYAPRQIKKAAVGVGSAEKRQVQEMLRLLLHLPAADIALDASDALAVALCEAQAFPSRSAIERAANAPLAGKKRPTVRT